MNNFLSVMLRKRYGQVILCLVVIGLLVFGGGRLLDRLTTSQGSERVYQLPDSLLPEPPVSTDPEVLAKYQAKVERIQAIYTELEQPVSTNDPDEMLAHLALQGEMLTLHQEDGTLVTDGSDPFVMLKLAKMVLSNLTPDKKLPVDVGVEIVDLLIENGEFEGAASFLIATQRAIENGDSVFQAEHWAERRVASSEIGTVDPCCPDDETEVVHRVPESVTKTPALVTTDSVVEVQPQKPLTREQFDRAKALIDEYGTEEGLQRLNAVDPEVVDRLGSVPRLDGVPTVDDP